MNIKIQRSNTFEEICRAARDYLQCAADVLTGAPTSYSGIKRVYDARGLYVGMTGSNLQEVLNEYSAPLGTRTNITLR